MKIVLVLSMIFMIFSCKEPKEIVLIHYCIENSKDWKLYIHCNEKTYKFYTCPFCNTTIEINNSKLINHRQYFIEPINVYLK